MPKFTVPLITLVAYRHEVEVNASDEEDAFEMARQIAMDEHPHELHEEADDWWIHDSVDLEDYEEVVDN